MLPRLRTLVETAKSVDAFAESGHIENASFIPYARVAAERGTEAGSVRYLLPDAEEFADVMRKAGVNDDDGVVIAPSGTRVNGEMTVAARLYRVMRYYGHDDVALLDGGIAAWRKAGGETVSAPAEEVGTGDFTARRARPGIHVSAEDVEAILEGGSATLTDNSPLEQFTGLLPDQAAWRPGPRARGRSRDARGYRSVTRSPARNAALRP